jgi:hypothetical protein
MPDAVVAEQLARALGGEPTEVGEADHLARLLREAVLPARFAVTPDETERALARLPRTRARRLRPVRLIAAAGVAISIAAALVVALPESRPPGVDVEAQALGAIRNTGSIVEVVTRVRRPGSSARVIRAQWSGTDGRTRVRERLNGSVIEDILREPGGRVVSYQASSGRVVVAPSCRSLAGVCSELIDPVSFYRHRLAAGHVSRLTTIRFGGRPAFRFILPAQSLGAGTTRIEQVVIIDAATYLPRRIVWRESRSSRWNVGAVFDVTSIVPLAEDPQQAFAVPAPPGTPVVQVNEAGGDLGRPAVARLTPARAGAEFPDALWVGRRYHGLRLIRVDAVRWRSGAALRLDYGPLTVWNFNRVIPPPLLDSRTLPAKPFPSDGVTARFYVAGQHLVVERDLPQNSVAVIAPELSKLQLFDVISAVRPLKDG